MGRFALPFAALFIKFLLLLSILAFAIATVRRVVMNRMERKGTLG
jgi:hypothetical protein